MLALIPKLPVMEQVVNLGDFGSFHLSISAKGGAAQVFLPKMS